LAGKLCPPNRQLLIQQYLNQPATLKKASGSQREGVVPEAFRDPLKGWARSHDLVFIPEYEIETKTKERRCVDGALLYELRTPLGYWEALCAPAASAGGERAVIFSMTGSASESRCSSSSGMKSVKGCWIFCEAVQGLPGAGDRPTRAGDAGKHGDAEDRRGDTRRRALTGWRISRFRFMPKDWHLLTLLAYKYTFVSM
jgi:hypothetical protein